MFLYCDILTHLLSYALNWIHREAMSILAEHHTTFLVLRPILALYTCIMYVKECIAIISMLPLMAAVIDASQLFHLCLPY